MLEKIELHKRGLETRKKSLLSWDVPESVKQDILKFLDELELGKVNKGKKIGESRQTKYLDLLRTPLEFFNKPINRIAMKDMEDFEKALSSGKIKSTLKNQPYAHATQVDMRKAIQIFFKWKLGKDEALKLTDWLDVRTREKTPEYLTEKEISKLYRNCRTAEQRFLIAVLFDSGARAEEFHNIRFEDVMMPENKDNFVKIALKEEYSKTKGRTISLYWKNTLEAVEEYLQERIKEGIRTSEPVFKLKYDAARQFLHRLGKSTLNKSLHYHLFRHSSATYYSTKINRQQLCYRYGWRFSSNMPDIYISRAGMENKELDEKFTATELEEVRSKLSKEEFERKKLQDAVETFMKQEEERQTRRNQVLEFLDNVQNDPKNLLNDEAFLKQRLAALSKKTGKA